MNNNYTEAPWKAEICSNGIEIGTETPEGHLSVAWVISSPKDKDFELAKCDAVLIAAAPDLIEAAPVVGNQGVQFGDTWISFDKLCGWDGEDGPARTHFYSKSIIAKGILEWAEKQRLAVAKANSSI